MGKNKFDLGKVLENFEQLKRDLPQLLANQSREFFISSFKNQGWDNNGIINWKGRKNNTDKGRKVLIKSGALRRSISIVEVSFRRVKIGSYLPYSKIHNEGFKGIERIKSHTRRVKEKGKKHLSSFKTLVRVKAHTRKMNMPKRQFMGISNNLENKHRNKILKALQSCFK